MVRRAMIIIFYTRLMILDHIVDATRLDTQRQFSTTFDIFRKLTAFHGVTITECEDQCFHRKRCKGALYNRLTTLCTLTDVYRQYQDFKKNKGTVFSYGFNSLQQALSTPTCVSCTDEQTCLSTEEGQLCKITECGTPPSIYTEYLGNMFSVNNKLVVEWGDSNYSIICGEDGRWAAVDTPCLPGWAHFDSACYFVDQTKRSHRDSQSFCDKLRLGAHLADLTTQPEEEFLRTWLTQQPADATAHVQTAVWIGGVRIGSTTAFEWSDGTPLSAGYINWDSGQPSLTRDCIFLNAGFGFRWHDGRCDYAGQSVCEYSLV